ncbi:MAG: hypothetical protein M3M91_09315 [Thermoproteota archaeon]|nr:hypothetical protein [Thermoproteota archaeon]
MAHALTFYPLHVKRAIVIGSAYIPYWPIAGAVAMAITLAKECQHPTRMGFQKI